MDHQVAIHWFTECYGEHSHPYPQLLVPLSGTMEILVGDIEYRITTQKLCLIPPRMSHQCSYEGRLLAINLDSETVPDKEEGWLSYPMVISMCGQITQLVDLIQKELRENPESPSVRYLYQYLYSKLLENCAAPSIRYLTEHYDLPLTVNQLAEIENYNVTYYNDWFKQQTGCSPSLYLRKIRIEKAQELLRTTDLSMTEIAVMVGYSSNSTFTRAFHSITDQTPKEYREEHQGRQAV